MADKETDWPLTVVLVTLFLFLGVGCWTTLDYLEAIKIACVEKTGTINCEQTPSPAPR